jgi:hypothetical protein
MAETRRPPAPQSDSAKLAAERARLLAEHERLCLIYRYLFDGRDLCHDAAAVRPAPEPDAPAVVYPQDVGMDGC